MGASKLQGSKVSWFRLTIKTYFKAKELNLILMQILTFKATMSIIFSRKWMKEQIKNHRRTSMMNHLLIKELKRFLLLTRKIMFQCLTRITILRTMDLLKLIICLSNNFFKKTCLKFYKLLIQKFKIKTIIQINKSIRNISRIYRI